VNLTYWFGAAWWVWLWPTIVGAPTIAIWTAYNKKKFLAQAEDCRGVILQTYQSVLRNLVHPDRLSHFQVDLPALCSGTAVGDQ
jgi:hypothetical protein